MYRKLTGPERFLSHAHKLFIYPSRHVSSGATNFTEFGKLT